MHLVVIVSQANKTTWTGLGSQFDEVEHPTHGTMSSSSELKSVCVALKDVGAMMDARKSKDAGEGSAISWDVERLWCVM